MLLIFVQVEDLVDLSKTDTNSIHANMLHSII